MLYRIDCVMCKTPYVFKLTEEEARILATPNRPHIQDILPHFTPAEREMLISRVCEKCWKNFIIDEEE